MLHALPTEPTRQHWELTKAGEEELREKIARFAGLSKSPSKPLSEPIRAESYATYTNLILMA
jgi:hypothetical protein